MNLHLDLELIIRIAVGTLLGGVIGYERDIHGRPAGLRTHALVSLASATFMVVSTHMVYFQDYRNGEHVDVDGARIAASVVSGIGFLAGGAILRTGITIQGLTTAAGLWLVAAIGLAAGGGMYLESVAATVFGIAALTLLRRFEDKDDRVRRRLTLVLTESAIPTQALVDKLIAVDLLATVEGWDNDIHGSRRQVTLSIRMPRDVGERTLLALLERESGIARVQLDPAS